MGKVATPLNVGAALFGGPVGAIVGGADMLNRGLKPKFGTPSPPNAQPPITTATPAVQQAQADAIARRQRAKGFNSTVLKSFLEPSNSAGTLEGLKSTIGS